ncbi:MAG: T9SS type A sorting domain-containing protein, partial [Paludibacter sp.]|nr:T9SS type A sorting domain-containing protein [Paludibacter sp.]
DITWSTPNWGQGTLTPGSNYDVRIPSNRKVTNTGTAASKMLHLESASPTEGSQLINDGGTLTVADKIKVKVTLSDANAWRFVGFPFAVSKVFKADGVTEAVAGTDYQIATYNAATRANGQSGWEAVTEVNTTNPLVAGKGYIVASAADLFFETASTPTTTAFGASNDAALSFTTGTGAANHHGWNFIVSPVVANAFLTLAEGQFRYVYDGTSYVVDDTSDGTLTEYPFRAFFVKTAAAADKTFSTDSPSPAPALGPSGSIGKATFYLNNGTSEYSTKIRINELSTEMYDPAYDAEHLFPFSTAIPQIYTRMDGKSLAINSVPAGTTIPLYLRIPQAGNFTLRWNQQTDDALSLYDATTNTTVQLDAATEYNFTVNETGTLSSRFSIHTGTDVTTAQTNTLSKSIKLHVDGKLLHISGVECEAMMQLLDIAGRQLVNQLLVDRFEYTLPHAGVYIVRIVSDKGNKEYKVIVR